MVRNRFICGIRSSGIRMQLLSLCEETTTVDQIFELAFCWKLARKENKSHNVEANSFNSHSEIDTVSYSNNVFSVD